MFVALWEMNLFYLCHCGGMPHIVYLCHSCHFLGMNYIHSVTLQDIFSLHAELKRWGGWGSEEWNNMSTSTKWITDRNSIWSCMSDSLCAHILNQFTSSQTSLKESEDLEKDLDHEMESYNLFINATASIPVEVTWNNMLLIQKCK